MRRILAVFSTLALMLAGTLAVDAVTGGPMDLVMTAGSLTLDGAVPGSFVASPSGSTQTVYTTLTPYQAADSRGNGAGWHVTFQATPFSCTVADSGCPASGHTFATGSLLMPPPVVTCAPLTLCVLTAAPPTVSITGNTAIDTASAVTIASAAVNKGMGTYDFTPGLIGGTGRLQLTVPSGAYATTYHSTLTVSIVSGP